MVLPEGFVLPPWYLLGPTLVVLGGVVAFLWSLDPPVTDRTVLAFTPWMMLGATLHVLYRFEAYPASVETLFATPSVYLVAAIATGIAWILGIVLHAAGIQPTIERVFGGLGVVCVGAVTGSVLLASVQQGTFEPFWPVIALVITVVVTALAWLALGLWFTDVATVTGLTGAIVVFGHTLDGVTTAIGYDVLGAAEEVPLSRLVLETGEALPTYEYVGAGWLFVLVKVVLPLVVLGLFREFVEEAPRQARLLLAFIAAVGLGPGIHNTLLFMVG
ncbi:DUF63 family protein [Salinadaptatus halalkaliphilus]|uniref:DUF63 family protein n=1 Tax=Salinadaptatus halalkaliphilus TaxID=2419781 RepID=A0A4S3TPJ6_9EURY|nr:DUF63 family protein [Salinadaptatus halalkaliphilus]THE66231.1 DUF63 family protein [Salinadaptatus halalkaliphilus]